MDEEVNERMNHYMRKIDGQGMNGLIIDKQQVN